MSGRTYTTPKRLFYFGAWAPDVPGHYFWAPEGAVVPRGLAPWGWAELDAKLCPRADDGEQMPGAALLHHRDGWSALSFWDRSADPRGNSNSAFVGEGISSACAILDAAKTHFPTIIARLEAAGVRVRIDDHAQELLEAAAALRGG